MRMVVKNNNEVNRQMLDNLPWFDTEEKAVFIKIDREQEDRDVDKFQKTNDVNLIEKVYRARMPTLQIWANKYYYLMDSKDDMYGEFCLYFTKATLTYKKDLGSFNTWLFYLLINCVRNILIERKAKKRLPEGIDPNSFNKFMLSLDYSYDGKDGSDTLKDVIANKMIAEENTIDKMIADETVEMLSNSDPFISSFLKRLSNGNTIASLLKEYRTRKGKIKISRSQIRKLHGGHKQTRVVMKLIKDNTSIKDDFLVMNYSVSNPNKLYYTIEMRKTKEADLMMRTIRKLRKDKKNILSKIAI